MLDRILHPFYGIVLAFLILFLVLYIAFSVVLEQLRSRVGNQA